MAPAARRRLRKPVRAPPMEPRGMEVYDVEGQESRGPSGPEDVPEGNNPATDNHGEKRPYEDTLEEELGNEVQKVLEGFQVDIKQALIAKRKKFEMNTKASIKTAKEKIDRVWKTQQEQRQNLHLEYSQQFQTLFREWDIDIQKAQEQEEKLANMFQEQRKSLQQARIVQNQRLKKIQNLYEQFLKSMEELEKDHDRLLTDEQNEVRQEMAKLQDKIMVETQQQELAIVQKSLQSLLF
ncbi:synaptonemal complex protein 3-like isoform X2 [Sus scrofa]|uniref:synaptonemal complex protein 3-like isoform X2 n=1 Tax=Sus scrofa TaxID=9823 RepID=UPI0003AEB0CF|nr:synaptonemal complex protein 3-like isoform X2 [Sus scrofa]